jgi:hypothetical protein
MKRYLVIANQTIAEQPLADAIAARAAAGPCHFHIVVPATPMPGLTWTDGEALGLARRRLAAATAVLRAVGASVDGEVGEASPVVAAADALRSGDRYDEVIVSTFPPGASRWLRMDLPRRLERICQVPVHHVVAPVAGPVPGRAVQS